MTSKVKKKICFVREIAYAEQLVHDYKAGYRKVQGSANKRLIFPGTQFIKILNGMCCLVIKRSNTHVSKSVYSAT